jgi:uncharacterized membrane protein YfcA
MSGKQAILALASIIIGAGLGYFWSMSRPQDPIEWVVGLSILAIALVFFSLTSMGKH